MSIFAMLAALGASLSWATGTMIAYTPAKHLGAFEFTRTQLVSSALLLVLIATMIGAWPSVTWQNWPAFVVSITIGVIASNLAMAACLRRGGPRRTQLLETTSAPIAAGLGWIILGESVSIQMFLGSAVALGGIALAISHGSGQKTAAEAIHGSFITVLFLGILSAAAQAIGLIAMKPVLLAGTDPVAASALRTGGAALIITVIAIWPARAFSPNVERTGGIVLRAIFPGILGYVVAVSLLLYALRHGSIGVAAVLGSTAPVMMLPMIWFANKQRPPLSAWAGAVLVVAGIGIMLV
jgi:drug/metabolite transporter (DMT)-like permease